MRVIELIPVIEMPCSEEAWDKAKSRPEGSWLSYPDQWEQYRRDLQSLSGYRELSAFPRGSGLYPLSKIAKSDLTRLIELHVADTEINESCAFFGGYVLTEKGIPILVPQCCGTLADISTWEKVARPEKFEEYFCLEGHPCPEALSDGVNIEIRCIDEFESFEEPAPASFVASRIEVEVALRECIADVKKFATCVDDWGEENGHPNLSRVLIYESS